jgi:D-amino peptidase
MKIYISADIEGITGVTNWDDAEKKSPDYEEFRKQMTAEVAAACRGALAAGADEIWVRDAHDSARNLIARELPDAVRLMRGWSGHPFMMMDGLDSSFQAALMVGYHSRAGSALSPLSHTMTGAPLEIRLNGQPASEFLINTWSAALVGVPVVFLAGDAGLCTEASSQVSGLTTVAVKEGRGEATLSIHPALAVSLIEGKVAQALKGDLSGCLVRLPARFTLEVVYKEHTRAFRASFFPGASLEAANIVRLQTGDYMDVLRFVMFAL